jgi:hypothetical protein
MTCTQKPGDTPKEMQLPLMIGLQLDQFFYSRRTWCWRAGL